jgi:hypothetical protein
MSQEYDLTPGQRGIIETLRQAGVPLTRDNYINCDWNDHMPDDWTAEHESDLPEFLQGADAGKEFDYDKALTGGYYT